MQFFPEQMEKRKRKQRCGEYLWYRSHQLWIFVYFLYLKGYCLQISRTCKLLNETAALKDILYWEKLIRIIEAQTGSLQVSNRYPWKIKYCPKKQTHWLSGSTRWWSLEVPLFCILINNWENLWMNENHLIPGISW